MIHQTPTRDLAADVIEDLVDADKHRRGCLGCQYCCYVLADDPADDPSGPCLDPAWRDYFRVALQDDGSTRIERPNGLPL